MVELTDAFVGALERAGIHAASARGAQTAPRLRESAVAVQVDSLASDPGGFAAYLGLLEGRELYGMRLHATVGLSIRSPAKQGADACRRALDDAAEALSRGVEGVSILGITAKAPAYDPVGDCFGASLAAECRCWLCTTDCPDAPGELEHFILKGALT